MRITPLAVWGRHLSESELGQAVQADISMTHSKKAVWHFVTAYCIAIKVLLKNSEVSMRA